MRNWKMNDETDAEVRAERTVLGTGARGWLVVKEIKTCSIPCLPREIHLDNVLERRPSTAIAIFEMRLNTLTFFFYHDGSHTHRTVKHVGSKGYMPKRQANLYAQSVSIPL